MVSAWKPPTLVGEHGALRCAKTSPKEKMGFGPGNFRLRLRRSAFQSPTISHWTTLHVTFVRAFAHLSEGTTMKTRAIFASCLILFGGSLAAAEQPRVQEQPQQQQAKSAA